MRKLILMLAVFACTFAGYSQDSSTNGATKGTLQLSTLQISSSDVAINVSSPALTYFFIDDLGLSLGIANFDDINVGARYYIAKSNNFAYTGYGTASGAVDIGLGKTYGWGDHVQIEPRLNFTDVLEDDRNLGLSVHLNLVF
jgi:hypothetical protein